MDHISKSSTSRNLHWRTHYNLHSALSLGPVNQSGGWGARLYDAVRKRSSQPGILILLNWSESSGCDEPLIFYFIPIGLHGPIRLYLPTVCFITTALVLPRNKIQRVSRHFFSRVLPSFHSDGCYIPFQPGTMQEYFFYLNYDARTR